MIKEVYIKTVDEICARLRSGAIDSTRSREITRGSVRLYENGKIGIAGALGTFDEEGLTQKAKERLDMGVVYTALPTAEKREEREDIATDMDAYDFLWEVEELLKEQNRQFPEYSFVHDIRYIYETHHLKNVIGLDLSHKTRYFEFNLTVKRKDSENVKDGTLSFKLPSFDKNAVIGALRTLCEGLSCASAVPEGKIPVLFFFDDFLYNRKLWETLNGISYGSGSSLFSGKMGEKVFSEELTLYQSRSRKDQFFDAFFDMEGITNPEDRCPLIENGILRMPFTDKMTAKRFFLPLTGAASAEYDSVPSIDYAHLAYRPSDYSLLELLRRSVSEGEGKALIVLQPTGGDYSADGHFSLRLQTGIWYDGERCDRPVQNITLTADMRKMLGDDWIGVPKQPLFNIPGLFGVCFWMTAQPRSPSK
ncbi:MAG TPA: metallopeptidase TldD-related protein [Thermotogota bacterium]|jgi:PmbA protein|nr:metallopeptidase TldD-related protein [Thermotogota bacterium]HPX97998.1 metallopeptidase TldD-related protein [Thermotogota bacterium]